MSVSYYNERAQAFAAETLNVDMSSLYQQFLAHLKPRSFIIDAGCGAGRDSLFFVSNGYRVDAFDSSEELVKIAAKVSGLPVQCCKFSDYVSETKADAIWACASLLHVPAQLQYLTFTHLAKSLKAGGIFYCSYKLGTDSYHKDGREFTNANEQRLNGFLEGSTLAIKQCWITNDARPNRSDEQWLNAILVKNSNE